MLERLDLVTLILQLIIAALASVGAAAMCHSLWRVAQNNQTSRSSLTLVRGGVDLLIVVIGVGFMLAGRVDGFSQYTALTSSVGLVVLSCALVEVSLHKIEYTVRSLALLVGIAASVQTFGVSVWLALGLTVIGLLVLGLMVAKRVTNAWMSLLFGSYVGLSYWLTVGGQNGWQGAVIAVASAALSAFVVSRQHLADVKKAGAKKANAAERVAVPSGANTEESQQATYAFFTQPMVDATQDKQRLMGYELLLRVYDYANERWAVPQNFDVTIGKQVKMMEKVIDEVKEPRLALNMTAEDFVDENIMHQLTDFARTSDKLKGLIIELTHAPTLEEMQRVAPQYHEADIRIAVDDVGSENHFEGLQGIMPYLDGVKFAMQNLRRQNDTANLDERMHFWYDLAAEYDIDFIMEGIENKEDEKYAKEKLGVQYLQGYYYGRPELPGK